jgi:hypothetical protein
MNNPVVLLILNCICYPAICWVPITVLVTLSAIGRIKLQPPIARKDLVVRNANRDVAGFGGGPRR